MIPPVLSQRTYPGAGDRDDCWIVATVWAAICHDPALPQPSVTAFRAHAGDPDDGVQDGGNLDEVIRGARGSWPQTVVERVNAPWDTFRDKAYDTDRPASLAVLSRVLPPSLRYGFEGPHQVGVLWDGGWYVANPLARAGTAPQLVSEASLKAAALALPYGGNVRAAVFPPRKEIDMDALFNTGGAMRVIPTGTPVYDAPNGRKVSEVGVGPGEGSGSTVFHVLVRTKDKRWGLIDGGGENRQCYWIRMADVGG